MKTRIISALLGVAIFIPFIILGGGYFTFAMAVLGVLAMQEFAAMKKVNFFSMIGLVSSIGLLAILVPQAYTGGLAETLNPIFLFYMTCLILLIFTVFIFDHFNFDDVAILVLGALYVGYGFHFLILIRDMGIATLMYQFMVIWSTDSGAYFIGKFIGKHKLAPHISPNKTVEGLIGGLLVATVVGLTYNNYIQPDLGGIHHVWLLTIVLSLFGQLGDLVESAFKRHFGVKDSGKFLPGHGGVLDRFDSTIFASFMFMIWQNLIR